MERNNSCYVCVCVNLARKERVGGGVRDPNRKTARCVQQHTKNDITTTHYYYYIVLLHYYYIQQTNNEIKGELLHYNYDRVAGEVAS